MQMGHGAKGSLVFAVPTNHHTLYSLASPVAGPQQALALSSTLLSRSSLYPT